MVVVAGNIGAGKTSLTERIGTRLGWRTDFESVADNPYLPDFIPTCMPGRSICKYSSSAIAPISTLEAVCDPRPAILDRSIYEDAYIFSRALHHMGNLSERDYIAYRKLFELVVTACRSPIYWFI